MRSLVPSLLVAAFVVSASRTQTPAPPPPVLHVVLLAGQSNMEGHGVVDLDDARDYNGGRGTLAAFLAEPANRAQFRDLLGRESRFGIRSDVFVTYRPEHGERKVGPLSVGFGAYPGRHHIGPELGIGRALGQQLAEPVLLVKTAWGGKSLAVDFRPPSAGGPGPFYTRMLAEYREALAQLSTDHPRLAKHTPKLAGFVWFQGWNDACDDAATAAYATNLTHLIGDLRREFGEPTLPIVVGETGNWDGEAFRRAQQLGTRDPAVAANTRFVATRQFLQKAEDSPNTTHGHHWYGNGGSYLRIGDALGKALVGAIAARTPLPVPDGEDPLRWQEELAAFDREPPLPPGVRPVVFVGSSSMRGWKTLAADMAPLPVVNRGFGGSRLFDTTYWLDRLVVRHDPAVVVVFAGSNDLAGKNPRTAAWLEERFVELVARLRALGCTAPLVYVSITKAPSRAEHAVLVDAANARIAARCAADPSLVFVDTATGMLTADGAPDPKWFQKDLLHLNAEGYRHWTTTIRPVVETLLAASAVAPR